MKKIIPIFFVFVLFGCSSTSKIIEPNFQYSHLDTQGTLTEQQKSDVILFSFSLMDTKYKWGSKKPDFGLDCSGLISYIFDKSINIKMYGAAKDIVKSGKHIPLSFAKDKKLEQGDLLFFNTTGQPYSHVGIYIGDNRFLHASSKKGKVVISNIFDKYYFSKLERIKRI